MENVYFGDWSNLEEMLGRFNIGEAEVEGFEVLYAWYECADYSGTAFVLLQKDGNLYEVNASHCSCYGLEGQFDLEETNVKAVLKRQHYGVNPEVVQGLVGKLKQL